MIGYLRGRIVENTEETLVLDVGGVGYELQVSTNTLDAMLTMGTGIGGEARDVQIWVQTHMREDALSLFGFATPLEKKMFLSLTKVNGVGPKMAIKILSAASLDQLTGMIEAGDVKALSGLPKVGKKTAEQLVLSLKGKLVMEPDAPKSVRGATVAVPRFAGVRADIMSALVNLGFKAPDAERVVSEMPESIDLQQGVRRGLKALTSGV